MIFRVGGLCGLRGRMYRVILVLTYFVEGTPGRSLDEAIRQGHRDTPSPEHAPIVIRHDNAKPSKIVIRRSRVPDATVSGNS